MSSRCITAWTVVPDCSAPDSVLDWHASDLTEPQKRIAVSLYEAQPHAIDALGSTDTLARMAATFSALTGLATMPSTLFAALVALRKNGSIPARRQPFKLVPLAQGTPEVPA